MFHLSTINPPTLELLKSLTYFADAEDDINVEMLKDVSWEKIKACILEAVDKYNRGL